MLLLQWSTIIATLLIYYADLFATHEKTNSYLHWIAFKTVSIYLYIVIVNMISVKRIIK